MKIKLDAEVELSSSSLKARSFSNGMNTSNAQLISNKCMTRRARSCGLPLTTTTTITTTTTTTSSSTTTSSTATTSTSALSRALERRSRLSTLSAPAIHSFFHDTYSIFCAPATIAQFSLCNGGGGGGDRHHSSASSMSICGGSNSSIIQLAEDAGLFLLNPSDLVFESSYFGIAYYDFVLSATPTVSGGYQLYLVKFDAKTNVESLETLDVREEVIKQNMLPYNDLAMITLAVLTWKNKIQRSRILCLVKTMDADSTQSLEALKKATNRSKCFHHVLSVNERRTSLYSSSSSRSSNRVRSRSPHGGGMRLRVLMCQTHTKLDELPVNALRETRCLLLPSSNPILCLCFPLY